MNTLNEFKKKQSKEIEIICDLLNFLEMGENLGVEIDKTLKDKLLNAINEVKTENGFMSTTKNSEIAEEWGGFSGSDMPIIMNISTKKDTKGIDLSKHKMEQEEVLLKRNQKYKIKKIYGKNGNIFVDVELI